MKAINEDIENLVSIAKTSQLVRIFHIDCWLCYYSCSYYMDIRKVNIETKKLCKYGCINNSYKQK